MIRCPWCSAKNYAIDMWCTKCHHHLELGPAPARRRGRLLRVLPPLAAAAGIALAVASPAAAWHTGSLQLSFHALPATGSAVAPAETGQAQQQAIAATPGAPAAPAPSTSATPSAGAAPAILPTPAAGTPPLLAAPPVFSPVIPANGGPSAGDPAGAVDAFYRAVSSHEFGTAAAFWSPAMKAAYPPAVYINQRFSATQQIGVSAERVLTNQAGTAVIYVDVHELIGGQQREWVGTWQLVQDQSQWLLNSPSLSAA